MNDKIMNIIDLVKMIKEMGYIDCKKENNNDATYESILFYLKFCQSWFLMQQIDTLEDELINGKDEKQPNGLMSILEKEVEEMNEFVLKEKHKYWDNKITLEKYIKDVEESGYIDCTSDYEYEYWYILENLKKINNLQSKIDKAIDYLYEHSQYNDGDGVHYIKEDEYCVDYLLDILKEDK